ncbi:hypothetical protein HDV05_006376 [Chytridiales sp. JEL 0842]|nr:hypothetical protein HDV05_006376 [Chytridiales sp. JEL 0842]
MLPPLPNLKSLKKGHSGTQSGLLGGTKEQRDTRNFPIKKKVRFANRFFQIAIALASYYFLGRQSNELMSAKGLWPIINFNWFVAAAAPIVSGAVVAQYFLPIIITNWNSRKILAFELLMDVSMTVLWIACFSSEVIRMGNDCPPGTSSACDVFNWVLAWNILRLVAFYKKKQTVGGNTAISFSFILGVFAIGLDIYALLSGFGFLGWGERIQDLELDASIRRMGRRT